MGRPRTTAGGAGHDDLDATAVVGAAPPSVATSEPVPERIGPYRIERVLGHGGMGVVYAAFDERLQRPVAIKLLRRIRGSDDAVARLRREAQALAQLSDENVVAIYEVGEHEGKVYLAMELVDGTPLDEWLSSTHRPWSRVLEVLRDAGRGLAAAHDKGLIHRDFKPANVILGDDGRVRVLDFGLARVAGDDAVYSDAALPTDDLGSSSGSQLGSRLTAAGTVMGTPGYMAPEQFTGDPLDPRTDQYAFCVTLFEAFAGRRPYRGSSFEDLRARVMAGEREPPPKGSAPAAVWALVERGLALRPEDRHPDLPTLLRALDRAARPTRWPWLAAGVVAVGVTVAVAVSIEGPGCGDVDGMADTWNANRRDAVVAALEATHTPYGDHAAREVPRRLDDYADAWRGVFAETCGVEDPGADARMQCLRRARTRVAATLEVLAQADSRQAARAITAVANLPDPSDCTAADREPAVPDAVRNDVAEIREAIAAGEARAASGKLDDAVAQAQALVARAEATAFDPVVAEARVALARNHKHAGDYAAAGTEHAEAFWLAQRAGADEVAVSTGVALVFLYAQHLAKLDEARTWARHTEGALARLPSPPVGLEGAFFNSRGVLHERAGDTDAARADYGRAVQLWRDAHGGDELSLAAALLNLANAELDADNVERARQLQAEALQIREHALGPDHPLYALALADTGNLELRQGNHEAALPPMQRALAIDEAALGPEHPTVSMMLANLANVQEGLGDLEAAAKSFDRALAGMRATLGDDHPNVAVVTHNLADLRHRQGRLDEAITLFERSHEGMVAAWGEDHPQVIAPLRNLAAAYSDAERHADAEARLRTAQAAARKRYGDTHPELAGVLAQLGETLTALDRPDEARAALDAAVAIYETAEGDWTEELAEARRTLSATP